MTYDELLEKLHGQGKPPGCITQAFAAIRPAFDAELKISPRDVDGAWGRAVEQTKAAGAFDAIGWRLYPDRFFHEVVKEHALKALGYGVVPDDPAFWEMIWRKCNPDDPAQNAEFVRGFSEVSKIPEEVIREKLRENLHAHLRQIVPHLHRGNDTIN